MNGSASVHAHASELAALRRKVQLLMRMVTGILILWLATVLVHFVSSAGASQTTSAAPAAPVSRADSLRVRELVVVDAKGTPRVRIAAPLPEPIMLGRRSKRGDAVSGVLLYHCQYQELAQTAGSNSTMGGFDRWLFANISSIRASSWSPSKGLARNS